jgi:hypothetical protein
MRSRIQIRTCNRRIRMWIREAQKHPDPEHWFAASGPWVENSGPVHLLPVALNSLKKNLSNFFGPNLLMKTYLHIEDLGYKFVNLLGE